MPTVAGADVAAGAMAVANMKFDTARTRQRRGTDEAQTPQRRGAGAARTPQRRGTDAAETRRGRGADAARTPQRRGTDAAETRRGRGAGAAQKRHGHGTNRAQARRLARHGEPATVGQAAKLALKHCYARVSCPGSGRKLDPDLFLLRVSGAVTHPAPQDLVRHVCVTTGLAPGIAERVIADVIAYFGETAEEFVRRRHNELHRRQYKNPQIWPLIANELGQRPVAAPGLSQRQLRRIVYG